MLYHNQLALKLFRKKELTNSMLYERDVFLESLSLSGNSLNGTNFPLFNCGV
jgi:hypothetical protein